MDRMRTTLRGLPALVAVLLIAAVIVFYVGRLSLPLPLYAIDEGTYLIRALYPPEYTIRDPWLMEINNGAYFALVRAAYIASEDFLVWIRIEGLAAYIGAILLTFACVARALPRDRRWLFLAVGLAFPYYRFVVTAMPEGTYVLLLAALGAVTVTLYRGRPLLHAAAAGALAAALVLTKPHGVAVVAAFAALMAADAVASRDLRRLPRRIATFAIVFLATGDAIQAATGQEILNALAFFVPSHYGRGLAATGAETYPGLGALGFLAMASACALMLGVPAAAAASDLARRWRTERAGGVFRLEGADLLLLLLALSLVATVAMIALYTMKLATEPAEMRRLWGRYFEFFIPLIWVAAAPAIVRWDAGSNRASRLAAAAITLAGLAGLLFSFHAEIVLFPWDGAAVTAFFHPHPVRAPVLTDFPFRALAVAATLLATAAILWRGRATAAWLGAFLAFGALSTWLDHIWVQPIVDQRRAFHRDMQAAARLPAVRQGRALLSAPSPAEAHLGFLALDGHVHVAPTGPEGLAPGALGGFDTLIVARPAPPPPPGWRPVLAGEALSLYVRSGARSAKVDTGFAIRTRSNP